MAKKLREMTYQELMDEAAANSAAWHAADDAAKEELHQRNQAIYSLADAKFGTKSGFANDGSGVWAHSGGDGRQYTYESRFRNEPYSEWKRGSEYQALLDNYRNQANVSMQDVIGQLSARTGGIASSYAATAAAQQHNAVMAQLENIARQMYEGDRAAAIDEYQLNRAAEAESYQRQRDAENTAYERAVYEREYNDAKELQQRKEDLTAEEAARARVLEYFTGLGGTSAGADEAMRELIARSGYTDAEIAAMEKSYATLMALQRQKSAGSGGSEKVVTQEGEEESELYDDILKKAQKYEDYDEAIAYLERMVAEGELREDEKKVIETVYLGGDGEGETEEIVSRDQLSEAAKSKLMSMQLQIRRTGFTEAQKNSLLRAVERREITEPELKYILQVLGI